MLFKKFPEFHNNNHPTDNSLCQIPQVCVKNVLKIGEIVENPYKRPSSDIRVLV